MNNQLPILILSGACLLASGFVPVEAGSRNPVNSTASSKHSRSTTAHATDKQKWRGSAKSERTATRSSKYSGRTLHGKASFYGGKWHGRKTANGEIYNQNSMTAAHKTLPFNTRVRVTNLKNGRSVVLRINNRGPFKPGRIIDVSVAAANQLGMVKSGVVPAKVEVL